MPRIPSLLLMTILVLLPVETEGHRHHSHGPAEVQGSQSGLQFAESEAATEDRVSGQGRLRFRVLHGSDHLPSSAISVVEKAHGGFAVDRRGESGETYFALPGAGILRISADLKSIEALATPTELKDVNLHNTTIWYEPDGRPLLAFPANDEARVYITTTEGELVKTLEPPAANLEFTDRSVGRYFQAGGRFAPTDVAYLKGFLYVTTGYSELDYVLTAQIMGYRPLTIEWYGRVFGGRGKGAGQFGTGHGITVAPGEVFLDVADRPYAEIDRFTHTGEFVSTLTLPEGSFPCDIDYAAGFAIVGCLHGPDQDKGAPIYILEDGKVVSTILPKDELGLERFQHIHNAVLRNFRGKLFIIAQAWNPGDFAILEQLSD